MELTGKRTYISAAVLFVVAILQTFKLVEFDPEVFAGLVTALGSIVAVFLRAGVKNGN